MIMDFDSYRRLLHLTSRLLLIFVILLSTSQAKITLDPISVLYIPYGYNATTGKGLYGIAKGASEQSSYDTKHHILYVAGDHFIHIVNVSDPKNPDIIHRMSVESMVNDIEVCGDHLGYLQSGITSRVADGVLHVYQLYDTTSGNWTKLFEIPVRSVPDMLYFTKDCQTIVVANEGEYGATADPNVYVDPEGIVSIIRLKSDGYTANHLNFTSFNERAADYIARGVRQPYPNSTFSQTLEPEYITISSDDTTVYVSLQENNAIAVIDLPSETIQEIYPLGSKSWKNLKLDASDNGEINLSEWDIYSLYQPDAIKYFTVGNTAYIVTANEGASVEYQTWSEEKRGKSLIEDSLIWGELPRDLISALNDTSKLGRLKFSQYDGVNASRMGKIDRLHFFGGRSISVRLASDLTMVYDTDDEVEVESSKHLTGVFNADTKPINVSPEDAADLRSDDSGPECESLAFGEFEGTRVLFVGIERLSAIMIFTFPSGSPKPTFQGFYRAGGTNRTYEQLLEDRNLGDLDPEDIKFLTSAKSPSGKPMLVVTNNIAGTIAFYHVINDDNQPSSAPHLQAKLIATTASTFLAVLQFLFKHPFASI